MKTHSATLACLGLLLLAACSSKPMRPDEALEAAEVAVGKAGTGTAVAEAQGPLERARGKLDQARSALQAPDYPQARRLAEQARADAELSIALADLAKAQAKLRELQPATAAEKP
ncbi:DUF4398 domain-containing protein [Solimonas sp. SE-A11]|uniref:DUF4398 domain-containing protein n=1 Tax=Solimonas sp. SE-A11 TaxID=3054954 RepID=UPI00259D2CCC|nr:DUF4398 domain-containing protein [Solimonas sp. SE-A11]MDM4771949.1 DUF4398 domain-containing protein [Solimonas sp. SE-A11]